MGKELTPRINRLEPNLIIDGGMEYWPDGDSIAVANGSALYGSVLMKESNISSGVTVTASYQTGGPSDLPNFSRLSKTAAGTLAAGTSVQRFYTVEGYDISKINTKEFTVIFKVRSSIASKRSVALNNGTSTHSYVTQYEINTANTWETKAVKFSAMNTCPGVTNIGTNGPGVFIVWSIINGTNRTTSTLNQWQSGTYQSGPGEDSTWLTGTNHYFDIAGVMVLPGDWTSLNTNPSAYNFVRAGKNWAEEMDMIGRYYENTYPDTNGRGWSPVGSTVASPMFGVSRTDVGMPLIMNWDFNTRKRTNPTVTLWNASTGAQGTWNDNGGATTAMTVFATAVGGVSFGINVGVINLRIYSGHAVADARFY